MNPAAHLELTTICPGQTGLDGYNPQITHVNLHPMFNMKKQSKKTKRGWWWNTVTKKILANGILANGNALTCEWEISDSFPRVPHSSVPLSFLCFFPLILRVQMLAVLVSPGFLSVWHCLSCCGLMVTPIPLSLAQMERSGGVCNVKRGERNIPIV